MEHGPWLKDVVVFLAAAGLVVPLFHRLHFGAVLGFLIVGVVVGPYGLGRLAEDFPWIRYLTIEDRARAEPFAELGVLFLLFLIGLELSVERLWSLRRFVIGVGGLQFLFSAMAIATAVALVGANGKTAVVLGLCLAMSSTAIVIQLLEEQGRSATAVGRLALSVLLFQDLMVAPVLMTAEVLGRSDGNIALALGAALVQAALAVAAISIVGRYLIQPVFRFAAQTGSRELIMAITLLLVIGVASATGYAGLSTAFGAFLAGVLLAETEYRHQVELDLAPFKGLLIGLFFITVGMTIDIRAVWEQIAIVVAAVGALLAIKAAILFAVGRLLRVELPASTEVAILLAQAGEFAFIIIGLGASSRLLPPETAQIATATVGISMMLTPVCAVLGRMIAGRLQRVEHGGHAPSDMASELVDHVVIGGYGRVGQLIARLLDRENVDYVALDIDGRLVTEQRKAGHRVYFGDAGRVELLKRVGAARARVFVVTVDTPRAAERMVAAARRIRPDALVFARAVDPAHAARLLKLGSVRVIPETVEASLQLGGRLLEALGIPEEAAARRIAEMREQELSRLTREDGDTSSSSS